MIRQPSVFKRANGVISPKVAGDSFDMPVGRGATFVVAASGSSALSKQQADYVCPGADDQVQIQAAIDACPAAIGSMVAGCSVCLMEGEFHISAPIYIGNGVNLIGSGIISTGLLLDNAAECDIIKVSGTNHGTHVFFPHIQDMYIFGNKNYQTSTDLAGIHFEDDCSDMIVERVWVHYIAGDGILADYGWYGKISNCWLETCSNAGLRMTDQADMQIYHSIAALNKYGIILEGEFTKANISNNYIKSNLRDGIWIARDGVNKAPIGIKILNNDILYNSTEATNIYSGIVLDNWETDLYHTIIGNRFVSLSAKKMKYGIKSLSNRAKMIVVANEFFDMGTAVLYNVGNATDSHIDNNIGFCNKNSGTATLANATTSIAVTHGLDVTPSAGDITVTPIEAWGAMTEFYTDTYTSTQFTIRADQNPGQDVDFAWKAIVL